jgi:hypothetical protein
MITSIAHPFPKAKEKFFFTIKIYIEEEKRRLIACEGVILRHIERRVIYLYGLLITGGLYESLICIARIHDRHFMLSLSERQHGFSAYNVREKFLLY